MEDWTRVTDARDAFRLREPAPGQAPHESSCDRRWADLGANGGPAEPQPLFLAVARDVSQPRFAFGAPRRLRLRVEPGF